jgi:hypothetical protein
VAFLPKTALALKGNHFSVLKSCKIPEPHHKEGCKPPTSIALTGVISQYRLEYVARILGSLAKGNFSYFEEQLVEGKTFISISTF